MRRDLRSLPALTALAALLLGGAAVLSGCGQQQALGKANSLIVISPDDSLWRQVRDTTFTVLEQRIFTVRPEKKFYVEPVDTAQTSDFQRLRTFKHVVIFGTPDNRFVQEVIDAADAGSVSAPAMVNARDVWARNQSVTAVVLEPDAQAASWRAQLADLAANIDERYRDFVLSRMYVSGPDTVAMATLRERFGFGLVFPQAYDVAIRGDEGPVIVRNDNPSPADLIRSVLVDWRSPPLDSLTAGAAFRWRAAVDSVHYGVPQAMDTTRSQIERLEVADRPALEVTGGWGDEGTDYPAGGPFIVRLVQCPDRTYFLDAWIYAPGKDKYQYLVQTRQILDSFTCGAPPPPPPDPPTDGG